jgi:hypothetical protein
MSVPIYGLVSVPDGWNAGASSVETIISNGYVSFRAADPCVGIVCGMNDSDTSTIYTEIDHAFYFTKGKYQVMELGVTKTTQASYVQTDVFKIVRRSTEVKYYVNDILVYTSLTLSTGPVVLDVSFYHAYDAIYSVTVFNDTSGSTYPGDVQTMLPIAGFGGETNVASAEGSLLPLTGKAYAGTSYMSPLVGMGGKKYAMAEGSLQPLESDGYSGLIYLTYTEGIGVFAPLESSASGLTGEVGTGDGIMTPMDGLASNYPLGRAIGTMRPMTGSAVSYPPVQNFTVYAGLSLPFFRMGVPSQDVVDLTTLSDGDDIIYNVHYQLIAQAVASSVAVHRATTYGALASNAVAVDVMSVMFYELLTNSATVSDSQLASSAAQLVNTALALGLAESTTEAVVLVSELVTVMAVVTRGLFYDAEVEASAADALDILLKSVASLVDSAVASSSVTSNAKLTVFATDGGVMLSSLTSQQTVTAVLNDMALGVLTVNVDGTQYDGWVMNTQSLASTQYQNYNFNSFAKLGNKYYGAMDEGIYLLEGDDDDGDEINALVQSGYLDFGTSHYKSIPSVYVGAKSDGDMMLRVVTTEHGVREENWYSTNINNDLAASDRITLGKGLRSRYWEFTLTNVDGADFDVHQIEMIPVILNRRL